MTPTEVFEQHYPSVCKIAANFKIPGMEPDDISQEAFAWLLTRADDPRIADRGFSAILVRNHLINVQRRATFLPTDSLDTPIRERDSRVLSMAETLASSGASLEDVLIEAECRELIRAAVKSLPQEIDRKVVEIHVGIGHPEEIGMSLRQTAKVLSITPDRAERAWKRSIAALRNNQQLLEAA